MKKKVTLVDVALAADVSAITVSRTLRQPHLVSEVVRERVLNVVKTLNYTPDLAASTLASRRSNVIGALVPSFSNHVFSDVLSGAYNTLENTPYSIQIGNFHYSPLTEQHLIPEFLRLKPAGLIITGTDQTTAAKDLLKGVDIPIVQIMDISENPIDMLVGFSHREASATAVQHLIAQKFTRIGFIGARMDPRSQQRMRGYQDALEAHDLFSPERIITTTLPSSVEIGGHLFIDLLAKAPDCDAIICNNDDLAVGACFECQRRNIRIPEQMGICGFNDLGTTANMFPRITSVHTPLYEMGCKAMRMLLRAMQTPLPESEKIIDLGFELRIRESTQK